MKCEIVKDLMILYLDNCCSDGSRLEVEEHIKECEECRAVFEEMKKNAPAIEKAPSPSHPRFKRINERKASVLQSVLLFFSFALTVAGTTFEASTPSGGVNGIWAFTLIVPSVGFMLSLANWYFVRIYNNKKTFAVCSVAATFLVSACGYIWAFVHFGFTVSFLFSSPANAVLTTLGAILTTLFCVLSGVLSNKFAALNGKE